MNQKMKSIKINKIIISKEGKRYLPIKNSGIPSLMILTDNIKMTRFGEEKKVYIEIKEILRWFKENKEDYNGEKKEIIEQNIKFMEKLNKKEIEIKNG